MHVSVKVVASCEGGSAWLVFGCVEWESWLWSGRAGCGVGELGVEVGGRST